MTLLRAELRRRRPGPEDPLQALDRKLARLARKLRNAADEARLALRLERLFGPGRVRAFSRFTFACLLALVALLVVDGFVPDSHAWTPWLLTADTAICLVFLWEFFVRLALAPRRLAWALRHLVTDLVPAIPFGLLVLWSADDIPAGGADGSWVGWITSLRLIRIPLYARYVRFLKPVVALGRILVFWVRGMDRIVAGMAPILNREVVLFERPREERPRPIAGQGREHRVSQGFERLSDELRRERAPALLAELEREVEARAALPLAATAGPEPLAGERPEPIRAEDALAALEGLTAEDVDRALSPEVVAGLGRMLAMLDLPLLRSLPLIGPLARAGKGATAADRVAHAGRRLAGHCGRALGFVSGWADLSGVLTAPQILDRIATALQRTTQRPAVRLLLFGFLYLLIKATLELLLQLDMPEFLQRFVGIPLISLGAICLVLLLLARWLKKIAGEASDRLLRFAEARYLNLLELERRELEELDRAVLVDRVLLGRSDRQHELDCAIQVAMDDLRRGGAGHGPGEGRAVQRVGARERRLALLLLDAQDGAFLHRTDTKGCEQFLSHPDLWSLRHEHLSVGKAEERRLARLDLASGGLFSGPFLWFDLLMHAIGLQVSRLVSSFNLHLVPLRDRPTASEDELARHDALLREDPSLRSEPLPGRGYRNGSFHALHFLGTSPAYAREIEDEYGPEVAARLVDARHDLVRRVFGTRALHRIERRDRCVNPYDWYQERLGGGRMLFLPWRLFTAWLRLVWVLGRMAFRSAKDILDPRTGVHDRVDVRAPFSVARRKLHRMKKPLLWEAIRLSARLDPEYLGLGDDGREVGAEAPWRVDLAQVDPSPAELAELEGIRDRVAGRLMYLPDFAAALGTELDEAGRLRLRSAFAADERGIARQAAAEARAWAWLYAVGDPDAVPAGALPREGKVDRRKARRGLQVLLDRLAPLSPRERRHLRAAFRRDRGDFRLVCLAWAEAGDHAPSEAALALGRGFLRDRARFVERLESLRAVTALILLDLHHHERIVYELGGYAEDGVEAPTPLGEAVGARGQAPSGVEEARA
ncbi:MAG: hypothetical protein R3F30_08385 [Planctomycetota bacterium]